MCKKRNSSIELLRMFSMMLIVCFHFAFKSNFNYEYSLSATSVLIKTSWLFGELGVNLFMLITGYFMVKKSVKRSKMFLFVLQVVFYDILLLCLTKLLGGTVPPFIPIVHDPYWYATAYFLVYLFSPYLNILVCNMEQKKYQKMMFTALIIFSLIPTMLGWKLGVEKMLFYNRFIWLIIVYIIGAYFRLYSPTLINTKLKAMAVGSCSFGLMLLTIILVLAFPDFFRKLNSIDPAYFWPPNTVPMIFLSISVFYLFLNFNIGDKKWINTIASTMFGVYLLHDGFLAGWLYNELFDCTGIQGFWGFCSMLISWIISVFFAGIVVDLIRQQLEKHIAIPILNKVLEGTKRVYKR